MKLIKKLVTLTFLFSAPFIVNAQYQEELVEEKKTRWGVFIAPSISWMNPAKDISKDGRFSSLNSGSKVGFYYGITLDYSLSKNFFIATGLQGNITGGKIFSRRIASDIYAPNIVNTAEFDYNLHYIELPVNLKFKTNNISGFHFFAQAGLSLAANISKKTNYIVDYHDNAGNPRVESNESQKLSGYLTIAPFLLQLNSGIGAEYNLPNSSAVYAGIFYNNSFLPDVTNPERYDLAYNQKFQDGNVRLNSFSLRLGFLF